MQIFQLVYPRCLSKLLAASVLAALTACASTPQSSQLPYTVPQDWELRKGKEMENHKSASEPLAYHYGLHFPGFDYQPLIQAALNGNYQIKQLRSVVDQKRANERTTNSLRWPKGTALLRGEKEKVEGVEASKLFSLQGSINWTIDLWGAQGLLTKAAQLDIEEARMALQAAQISVAAASMQNWFDWQSKQALYSLQQDFLVTLEATRELVERRFDSGLAHLLEVKLARSQIALARSVLLQRKQAALKSEESFRVLIGEQSSFNLPPEGLPSHAKAIRALLPAETIRQRPDITAAEKRLQSRELALMAAQRAWLPGLSFSASRGLLDESMNNLLEDGLSVSAIAFNLLQPVFNAGEIKSRQKIAKAAVSIELQTYAELVHQAITEVNTLLKEELVLKDNLKAAKFAVKLAQETQSLAKRQYNSGLTDLNTFLETHKNTIDTQTRLVEINNSWLQNRINLLLAFGSSVQTEINQKNLSAIPQKIPNGSHMANG